MYMHCKSMHVRTLQARSIVPNKGSHAILHALELRKLFTKLHLYIYVKEQALPLYPAGLCNGTVKALLYTCHGPLTKQALTLAFCQCCRPLKHGHHRCHGKGVEISTP